MAAKIQAFIKQLSQIGKGAFKHARPLEDLAYVTVQPGPKTGSAKVFLILRGIIEEIADFTAEPARPSELLRTIFTAAEDHADRPLDEPGIERIGIVARICSRRSNHRECLFRSASWPILRGRALAEGL